MDWLERLLNRVNDADWTWGPVVALRPARTERMGIAFWAKLTLLAFLAVETLVVGGLALKWSLQQPAGTPWLDGFLFALRWYFGRQTGMLASVTVAGMLLAVPFFWAWNRRVRRLCREAAAPPAHPPVPTEGVWPPPPLRPSASAPEENEQREPNH